LLIFSFFLFILGAACLEGRAVAFSNTFLAIREGEIFSFPCIPGRCVPCENTQNSSICCSPDRYPAHANPLCGKCAFGLSDNNAKCEGLTLSPVVLLSTHCAHPFFFSVDCSKFNPGMLFAVVVSSWFFVVLFHRASQSTSSEMRQFLYYVQMMVLCVSQDLRWLTVLEVFEFNTFSSASSASCLGPFSGVQRLLTGVFFPFLCFVFFFFNCLTSNLIFRCVRRNWCCQRCDSFYPDTTKWTNAPYVRTFVALLVFSCMFLFVFLL
jgi:hypothetical protein